jgi:hypothetical protein
MATWATNTGLGKASGRLGEVHFTANEPLLKHVAKTT